MDETPEDRGPSVPPDKPTPPPAAAAGGPAGEQSASAERPQRPPPPPRPRPQATAPRPAEGHGAKAPEPKLNQKGEATAALLRLALQELNPEIGGRDDEPVATVPAQEVQRACRVCKEDPRLDFSFLRCLSVVDYNDHLQVVYHLYSLDKRHKAVVKANVPSDNPRLPTVAPVWRGADWYEREGHDLFGVVFEGHPNLAPLLLYEGFEGHPGRKSFPFHDYQEW